MLDKLNSYIDRNNLFRRADRILLGVSGGIDSMVMASLFQRAGFHFGIAHCNFTLRDEESEEDARFVARFAENIGTPFFTTRFETEKFANENRISVQMAARELRMDWMIQVAGEEGFRYVALGHHLDDEVETFFLNLIRGTGIAGLHGILPKTGKLIHPMMFTGRQGIEQYAEANKIPFREDRTNKKTDYTRNRIRHLIIPEFEKIKPGFSKTLSADMAMIRSAEVIYRNHLRETWNALAEKDSQGFKINLARLKALPETTTYLFEFLYPFGFNSSDAAQISGILGGKPGKHFFSKTHRVILDRDHLLLGELALQETTPEEYSIEMGETSIAQPMHFSFKIQERGDDFNILNNPFYAQLDADKVKFPIKIRKWEKGDFFIPLGMKGRKLLSDFFTDQKFSAFQKEACWVMTSSESIIWIPGYRIDNRYKITENTKKVLEIRLHNP